LNLFGGDADFAESLAMKTGFLANKPAYSVFFHGFAEKAGKKSKMIEWKSDLG